MKTLRLLLAGAGLCAGLSSASWTAAAEISCPTIARSLRAELTQGRTAMEPEGSYAATFREAAAALPRCSAEEGVFYILLRSAELGGGKFPLQLGETKLADLRAAAEMAVQQHPRSVRIATVWARTLGTIAAAQSAVTLDPADAPAQVALGQAQLRSGNATAAQATLEKVPTLSLLPGGQVALARARLATGNLAGAVQAAQAELRTDPWKALEPVSRTIREQTLQEATEIEGIARLAQGHTLAAARLLLAAAEGGRVAARVKLETLSKDEKTQAELAKLLHDQRLPRQQRTLLHALLMEGHKQ